MSRQVTDQPSPHIEALDSSTVVDVDVHLTYNAEFRKEVAKHMEKPYRDYVDPSVSDSYATDSYPSTGWGKTLGGKRPFHTINVTDPEYISKPLCDGLGVDYPIINTSAPIERIVQTDRAVEEMRAANNVLIENFLDENDDFYGLASITTRRPEESVKEIERIGDEDQIIGVYFYQGEYMKPMGDSENDVIFAALEEYDLTPVYHISHFNDEAPIIRQMENNFSWHTLGPPWGGMLQVTSLIAQGTPEKFPELDFVFLEADLGIVPLLMARMNREYAQWVSELPLLEKQPEEYIRDSFYFSTQPLGEFKNIEHMKKMLGIIGADSLLFSSDHPHYDFDTPATTEKFLDHFSEKERAKVLHENAAEVFGIDL